VSVSVQFSGRNEGGDLPKHDFIHQWELGWFDIEDGEVDIGGRRVGRMLDHDDRAEAREAAVRQECLDCRIVLQNLCVRQVVRVRAGMEDTETEPGEELMVAIRQEAVVASRGADVEACQLTTTQGRWPWGIQLHRKKLAPCGCVLGIEKDTAHTTLNSALAPSSWQWSSDVRGKDRSE